MTEDNAPNSSVLAAVRDLQLRLVQMQDQLNRMEARLVDLHASKQTGDGSRLQRQYTPEATAFSASSSRNDDEQWREEKRQLDARADRLQELERARHETETAERARRAEQERLAAIEAERRAAAARAEAERIAREKEEAARQERLRREAEERRKAEEAQRKRDECVHIARFTQADLPDAGWTKIGISASRNFLTTRRQQVPTPCLVQLIRSATRQVSSISQANTHALGGLFVVCLHALSAFTVWSVLSVQRSTAAEH